MDNQQIIAAVENTGFDLEYYVYTILKNNGWQVISNRYYVDDVKNIEREIDIVAYKTKLDEKNKILYYTVMIISCKKCRESFWAFLTHSKPKIDPNAKELVVDNYSSDKRLEYMLEQRKDYIFDEIRKSQNVSDLFGYKNKVFAFQQINSKSYKTEDDKRIYDSILTCIKALEYEKSRKTPKLDNVESYFYNFNLLSVFDGEMIEVFFGEEKEVSEIQEIKYINRHIVNKKDDFYKVHFLRKDCFAKTVRSYNDLHLLNMSIYPQLIDDFYVNIFSDYKRVNIVWNDFCKRIRWHIQYAIRENGQSDKLSDEIEWYMEDDGLKIGVDVPNGNDYTRLNENEHLLKVTSKALKDYFRYEGKFYFGDPLPF